MKVTDLTWDERVFLAGSLRAMILADGVIDDEEIAWIDRLRDEDRFDEMDRCLDEFAARIEARGASLETGKPAEVYWQLAAEITRPEAQRVILEKMETISRLGGYQSRAEEDFFRRLRQTWKSGG
jgi:hypothetical protein